MKVILKIMKSMGSELGNLLMALTIEETSKIIFQIVQEPSLLRMVLKLLLNIKTVKLAIDFYVIH